MSIETFSKCRKSKVESKSCFFKHLKTVPRKTVKEPSNTYTNWPSLGPKFPKILAVISQVVRTCGDFFERKELNFRAS